MISVPPLAFDGAGDWRFGRTGESVEIVRLSGEYDLSRKDEIVALFQSVDSQPLVIDLTDVTYVDSTILREFSRLKALDTQRSITLRGANEHVRRILEIVQFDKIFEITP